VAAAVLRSSNVSQSIMHGNGYCLRAARSRRALQALVLQLHIISLTYYTN
jgi:hypothetical protein